MAKTTALYKRARVSPRKMKPLAQLIRGKKAAEALNILLLHNSAGAVLLKKTLLSAVANVENNLGENADEFLVSKVIVNEAPQLKRMRFRARGRTNRILKRSAHLSIELSN